MKRKLLAGILLLVMLMSVGCGVIQNMEGKLEELTGQLTDSSVLSDAVSSVANEVDDVEKYNHYIDISDLLSDRIDLCLTGYETRICPLNDDYKVTKKKFSGWINSIGEYEINKLQTAFDNAGKTPSMEPVDSKYLALHEVAVPLVNALTEAYEYYEAKSYVDDDFAKGEEIHNKIREHVEAYYVTANEFDAVLNELAHERTLNEISRFEEEGRVMLYWANVFILDAKELCQYLSEVELKKDVAQIDAEVYKALYDKVAASQAEFAKVATEEQAEQEGIRMLFSSFKTAVTEFKAEAANIVQAINDGDKVDVDDINDVFDEYSDMIDDYNRMIW